MRIAMKALGYVFLGLLFIQLLTLPTYRTVKQRDPYEWPPVEGIISGHVAIRRHEGDIVKGFLIGKDGLSATPFSAPETALRGPAAKQLERFDRMSARRRHLVWSVPVNVLLILLGFAVGDFWERRHPAPGHAMPAPETTPEADYKTNLSLKLEHARRKKQHAAKDDDDSGAE